MLPKLWAFLTTDVWRLRLSNYPPSQSFLLKQLRIFLLSVRGFVEDKCKFRASALTFFTLLSIVPVVAMAFGVSKGFGLDDKLKATIMERFQGEELASQKEVVDKVIVFSETLLDNTSSGLITGIGVVFLFWAVIKLLGNIENAFNDIWGIKVPRHIGRKFSDYLSLMLVCPFLMVISSSMTVMVNEKMLVCLSKTKALSFLVPFVDFLLKLKLAPFITVWLAFTFIFVFMPNTKVRIKSGLFGGVIAGTIFQFVQWVYIKFQVGAVNYGAIYGSFAALPLFLMWLQISWLVVLFGAELSFAHQNVETYEYEPDCLRASGAFKKRVSLLISHMLVRRFCNAEGALDATTISHTLEIPIRLVRESLYELVEAGILSEVKADGGRTISYQPGVDVSLLTMEYVVNALESRGKSDVPVADTAELAKISECMKSFEDDIRNSAANVLLKEI